MQIRYTPCAIDEIAIEKAALAARQLCCIEGERAFDICRAVEKDLIKKYNQKGKLRLSLFFRQQGSHLPPARVEFGKITVLGQAETVLYVDIVVWDQAQQGDPLARFIIAHEIGHIFLHDLGIANFSNSGKRPSGILSKEHNVEWQADTFAKYFLLPDEEVLKFVSTADKDAIDAIAYLYKIDYEVVVDRINTVERRERKRQAVIASTLCANCGGVKLLREYQRVICSECQFQHNV